MPVRLREALSYPKPSPLGDALHMESRPCDLKAVTALGGGLVHQEELRSSVALGAPALSGHVWQGEGMCPGTREARGEQTKEVTKEKRCPC